MEKLESKNNWLLLLILTSPVLVQLIDVAKELFLKKEDQASVHLARMEATLIELMAQRKAQEQQPLVFNSQQCERSFIPIHPIRRISSIPIVAIRPHMRVCVSPLIIDEKKMPEKESVIEA